MFPSSLQSKLNRGSAIVLALVIVAVMALAIASLGSLKSNMSLSRLMKNRVTRENLAEGGFNLVRRKLLDEAKKLKPPPNQNQSDWAYLDSLDLDQNAGGCVDTECPIGDHYGVDQDTRDFEVKTTLEALPHNPSLSRGTKNYILRTRVTHKTSGEVYTLEQFAGLQPYSLAEISYGVLQPSGPPPYNYFSTNFDGHVHFGVHPSFKGNMDFAGPVTFEEDVSSPTLPFDMDPNIGLNFQKGYKTKIQIANSLDSTEIADDVCQYADIDLSGYPNDELCLLLKWDHIERHHCTHPNNAGYVDALNAYGSLIQTYSISSNGGDDGLVMCARNRKIGIKGVYFGPATIVAQNIVMWGDVVSLAQAQADYSLGLISEGDAIIPMDVPVKDANNSMYVNHAYDHYSPATLNGPIIHEDNGGFVDSWIWFGETNFPSSWDFTNRYQGMLGYPDQDTGNTTYGSADLGWKTSWGPGKGAAYTYVPENWTQHCDSSVLPPNNCIDMLTPGSMNMPSTLDIEAALLVFGKLDVENLNNFTENPAKGFVVPACPKDGDGKPILNDPACQLYSRQMFVANSIYEDVDSNHIIDSNDRFRNNMAPIYCYDRGQDTVFRSDSHRVLYPPACPITDALSRGIADQIWINGSLITKDLANSKMKGCGGPAWQHCGFGRKTIKFNPIMLRFPPPYFPRAKNLFNVVVFSTKKYFGTGA